MTTKASIEIVHLHPGLTDELGALFAEIEASGENTFFHPHSFTQAEAVRLCHYTGQDLYYVLLYGELILGYSMLRGWDEGYTVPSLGLFIRARARGQGLGQLMVRHLHAVAQLRGASHIRLKVYKDNHTARLMYEQFGYIFKDYEGEQMIGFCEITPARSPLLPDYQRLPRPLLEPTGDGRGR